MKTILAAAMLSIMAAAGTACTPQQANSVAASAAAGAADAQAACSVGEAAGAVAEVFDPRLAPNDQAIAAGCARLEQIRPAP
jgi:hypothetical protein